MWRYDDMARGANQIIVSSEPKGKFMEGFVKAGETFVPGITVQRDPTVALRQGRHTYKIYAPGVDGEQPLGPFWVVLNDYLSGGLVTDIVAAGERCFLYSPEPGDELNMLLLNLAGTADDHPLGEKLMVDHGTGKLIVTTGSPETEVAQLLESVTDPIADTLAWVVWTGH
jgi:hypothetical protein